LGFKDFQREMEALSSDWLENNEKRLAESDWDNLYLPGIFWIFLRERVTALLESAVKKNLLSIIKG
jgi:hypothetical protein